MIRHKPVLLSETLEHMPDNCTSILDGTLGHGWHSIAMIQHLDNLSTKVVAVDKDENMIHKAKIFLKEAEVIDQICIVQSSYADFAKIVSTWWVQKFDFMLLDIWVNMDHFKQADRGFSLRLDWPLDMRFDTSQGMPVRVWLQKSSFEEMDMLFTKYTDFGQKYREWIIRDLLDTRKRTPFDTTQQVRSRAQDYGLWDKKLAVIFQAWRIHINDELWELERFLEVFTDYLHPGGRCAFMTYHSWEDRIVKYSFKEKVDTWVWLLYNKKVIKPSRQEVEKNRAARSAKLRIFEKI